MRKFIEKITQFSKLIGLEIELLPNQSYCFHFVVLEKKNDFIQVVEKQENISSLELLKEKLPIDCPIAVALSGKGILHKFVPNNVPIHSFEEVLAVLLPQANPTDFYHQIAFDSIVSIIRKDIFHALLEQLKTLNIIQVGLGAFSIAQLQKIGLLSLENTLFGKHQFIYTQTQLTGYSFLSESNSLSYSLGDVKLESNLLLAYSIAFQNFLPIPSIATQIPVIDENKKEWIEKKKFTIFGWGILLFFLTILCVNFMLFSSYHKKNQALQSQVKRYESLLKQQDSLQKKVDEKGYFLKKTGWLNACKTSYYADQIGASIPTDVQLQKIAIYPLDKKTSQKERTLIFEQNFIHVSGECKNATTLNPWIHQLKKMKWIHKIEEVNYDYDSQKKIGFFTIIIAL